MTPNEEPTTELTAEDIANLHEVLDSQVRLGHVMTLTPTDVLSRLVRAADIDAALRYSRPRIEAAARSQPAREPHELTDYQRGYVDGQTAARSQPATEGRTDDPAACPACGGSGIRPLRDSRARCPIHTFIALEDCDVHGVAALAATEPAATPTYTVVERIDKGHDGNPPDRVAAT